MNNALKDMRYLLAAAVLAASLFLADYGLAWAWYIGIFYLGFNAGVMALASGVLMNPDVFAKTSKSSERAYRNPMLQFLVQAITAIFLYALYQAGFMFTSGFFAFMLTISITSNFLIALATTKGKT